MENARDLQAEEASLAPQLLDRTLGRERNASRKALAV